MSKAKLYTGGRLIPILRDRPPRRRGAGCIEALSSYISSQALDCSCAPFTLFSQIVIPAGELLSKRWSRVRFGESHLINGYTEIAAAAAKSVESCARISQTKEMTLLGLERLCDPIGKHMMHLTRPWCPDCYLEARRSGLAAWDPLYSYLQTSEICIWHKKRFHFVCTICGRGQRFLPKFPFLDICEHCGADLAVQEAQHAPLEDHQLDKALWYSGAAIDVIYHLGRGEDLTAQNFARNVSALMTRHFSGQERPFARRIGIAESSPKNWVKRGSAPTWASLVDLAHRLDMPPSQLGSADPDLTGPHMWHFRASVALDKPHLRPSNGSLELAAEELEKEPQITQSGALFTVEGLNSLARRIQVSLGVLKRHFPDECTGFVEKRKKLRAALSAARDHGTTARLMAAVDAVLAQALPLTERNLKNTGLLKVSDLAQPRRPG